ncbi:MAG: SpoIIE family protein phosphatase [Bacteroidota bacterium]|nr:SpoIIE family protein phosphatase [Bacteroidota bacterium]MDP3144309.1 SpoIIE family protein phosphatase [Bacteroidota bacterium]MDP3556295.1 SpoIIE family protein phosphatase [Bacteroidota bacterium]
MIILFRKYLFIFLIFVSAKTICAQINTDSLNEELQKMPSDTITLNKIISLYNNFSKTNSNNALICAKTLRQKALEVKNKLYIAQANLTLGKAYNNISDFANASFFLGEAKKIAEELKNKKLLFLIYNTIGTMYGYTDLHDKALENFNKAYDLGKELNIGPQMANVLNNIGSVTYQTSKLDPIKIKKAKGYILNAIDILKNNNKDDELASKYNNVATMYCDIQNYDSVLFYLNEAKKIIDKKKLPDDLIVYFSVYGRYYTDIKKTDSAVKYYNLSLLEAKKLDNIEWQFENYLSLADVYEAKGDYKKAYEFFGKFYYLKDSVISKENVALAADFQNKLEREKKEILIEKLKASETRSKAINYTLIFGSVLILLLCIMIFSRYRIKKKSEILLQRQNILISQKNKDVSDSIHYAKKIQDAILPGEDYSKKIFPESFIYYQPKDIVSGDFYWCGEKNNLKFIAVADCTGHGVPGALMSMLGGTFLNEIIINREIKEPNLILDELKKSIVTSLNKNSDMSQTDGMDISLIVVDSTKNEINYAGANNSIYIIRNNELMELKPNKQPIGIYYKNLMPFTSQHYLFEPNDTVYLFTDGFADQFGGPKGKKYKYSTFKALLLEINPLNMSEQKNKIHEAYLSWKGKVEQTDDVLIVGIKF